MEYTRGLHEVGRDTYAHGDVIVHVADGDEPYDLLEVLARTAQAER